MAKRASYTFDLEDVATMVMLVANLNPDNYKHPKAKALIYRAKAAKNDDLNEVQVYVKVRP